MSGGLEERAALAELESRLFARDGGRPRLSRYRLLHRLGSGGMSVVFAAWDPELDRQVAVKLLREPRGRTDVAHERLFKEARTLARLQHPNLLQIYDVGRYSESDLQGSMADGVAGHGLFLVMELVHGVDLAQWLAREQPSRAAVLEVFAAAGRGLAHAHRHGVVHRDFKPGNVLLANDGSVKVFDFGLARDVEGLEDSTLEPQRDGADPRLTHTGTALGTPAYMAPEQHRGEPVDHRADQFAFCVSLAEALGGARLFHGPDLDSLLEAKCSRVDIDPRHRIPRSLRSTLRRGLRADPRSRFRSMDRLLQTLSRRSTARWRAVPVGLALVALVSIPAAAEDEQRCGDDALVLASETFGEHERAELAASFAAADPSQGERAASRITPKLDRWVEQWSDAWATACRSDDAGTGTLACLDASRLDMEATLEVLVAADAATVSRAPQIATSLPRLRCDQQRVPTVSEHPRLPEARRELARAKALWTAARYAEGMDAVTRAQSAADAVGDPVLRAEVAVRKGALLERAGDVAGATELLRQAYFDADREGGPLVAAKAATKLIGILGRTESLAASLEWGRHAQAQLTRAGGDERVQEVIHANLGFAYALHGDHESSLAQMQTSLRMLDALAPEGDWRTAAHLDNMGSILQNLGRTEEAEAAHRRALELCDRELGPSHPNKGAILGNLARIARFRGDTQEARRLSVQALEIIRRNEDRSPHTEVAALAQVGLSLWLDERAEEALAYYDEAIEINSRFVAEQDAMMIDLRAMRAMALLDLDDLDLARSLTHSVLQDYEEAGRGQGRNATELRERLAAATAKGR